MNCALKKWNTIDSSKYYYLSSPDRLSFHMIHRAMHDKLVDTHHLIVIEYQKILYTEALAPVSAIPDQAGPQGRTRCARGQNIAVTYIEHCEGKSICTGLGETNSIETKRPAQIKRKAAIEDDDAGDCQLDTSTSYAPSAMPMQGPGVASPTSHVPPATPTMAQSTSVPSMAGPLPEDLNTSTTSVRSARIKELQKRRYEYKQKMSPRVGISAAYVPHSLHILLMFFSGIYVLPIGVHHTLREP